MTALAQGSAGLALVMGFALLVTTQITAAAIMLAVQSAAVAVTASVLHQPLIAIPPLALAGGIWLVRHETPDMPTSAARGAKLGIGIGAALAIFCQSLGILALPAAIILLSVLLAATRSHAMMQMMALVAAQNGIALAGGLIGPVPALPAALLFPLACLALPLPLAAGFLVPSWTTHDLARRRSWMGRLPRVTSWLRWIDLGVSAIVFAATLTVPLDSLGSIFAPLLGLDGVLRSCARHSRGAMSATRRGVALGQSGFVVLAVCFPDLTIAWLALLAAMAIVLLPTLSRRRGDAVLAFMAAGLALFGLLLLPATTSVIAWFSLFTGLAMMAAVVPELAVVLVVLVLRLANQAPWPAGAATLGIGVAMVALVACAGLLTIGVRSHRVALLVAGQASIAALSICTGQADGRFAGLVLLILLILSRSAARISGGPTTTVAIGGLGGVPPLGVFPGLVLVALALSAHHPWLLLPVGVALIPIVLASLPRHRPAFAFRLAIPSIAWLPLVLAILAGYAAPDGLVHWWQIVTAGRL